jgi:hypothetical protein
MRMGRPAAVRGHSLATGTSPSSTSPDGKKKYYYRYYTPVFHD